jgi:GTPase SAR1 family protein
MQIWDTVLLIIFKAGQEAFRAIMRSFYKGICGIFFTFGIDNEESFNSLDGWVK